MKIDKIPTKKGMQDAAMAARKEVAADGINEINKKIRFAAEEGRFEVFVSEDELPFGLIVKMEMIEKLKENGFRVKLLHGDIDDYGQYYMGGLNISWRDTLWDKIIKIFFKGGL